VRVPIHQEVIFPVAPERIFALLTDGAKLSKLLDRRGRGGATEGAWFSLFGDQLEGRQIELVRAERVVQAWRLAEWHPGVYSIVRFTLTPERGGTRVVIEQDGYQVRFHDSLEDYWRRLYIEPMTSHFSTGERRSMSTFVFVYRAPKDYAVNSADAVPAWQAVLDGWGAHLVDAGNPVFERALVGNAADTVLAGYSIITADDLETAKELAKASPVVAGGGGVEVGMLTRLNVASVKTTAADHAQATSVTR
jgi:uncharacterized protein YndB with AHSA1/START domain